MISRRVKISVLATGAAVPGPPVDNEALCQIVSQAGVDLGRTPAVLAKRMGIRLRHFCRNGRAPVETPRAQDVNPALAGRAIRCALERAGIAASDLDVILGHTASPHTAIPPNIAWVADEVGFGGAVMEFRQACTGFASALTAATCMLDAGAAQRNCIVGSETGSVFFDVRKLGEERDQIVNFVQMGDASACVLLGGSKLPGVGTLEHVFYGSRGLGKKPGFLMARGGSGSPELGGDVVASFAHDFSYIKDNGLELFKAGIEAAANAGYTQDDIQWIIPHQVNGRMAAILAEQLGLPAERIFVNADRYGNTGSAAIWLAFDELVSSLSLRRGDRVLVLGAEATKFMFGGFVYVHGQGGATEH
jgi:3-oxoacyl-[acyl-carrier-protein] synthase-3